jgi:hypothetical protein
MGELGRHYMAASGTWEQYTERREVTDEQRQRWQELREQSTAAWLRGDTAAHEAAKAEQAAFRDELGDTRAHRLHLEFMHELGQRRAAREQAAADREAAAAAENEARQGWLARPHSKLTDAQIERAIAAAEQKRTVNLADAERARQQHAQTEPAVLAGQGPRVADLDASLAELRRVADVHRVGDQLSQRMWNADTTASMSAAQARHKEIEAGSTSRFRPRLRDRLRGEATELHARAEQARGEADDLRQQLAELRGEQGWTQGWDAARAAAAVTRAEDTYPRDRERAQQLDEQELDFTRQRFGWRQTAADTAAAESADLIAEQQLRAEMPPEQHTTEQGLRATWHREQQRLAAEQAAEQAARHAEYTRTQRSRTLGHDHDHDMGLGL